MVDRNLIREFNISDDELEYTFGDAVMVAEGVDVLEGLYDETSRSFETGHILSGIVLRREGDDVLVDVGYKSEGIVPSHEWEEGEEPPTPGQKIEVLLEEVEDQQGLILLSRRKAKRIRDWEKV